MFLRSQPLDQEIFRVDHDTKEMLKVLDFGSLSNMQVTQPTVEGEFQDITWSPLNLSAVL